MANRYEERELDAARESLKSLTDKSESLRDAGGNLDRTGEPALTAGRAGGSFTPSSTDPSAAVRESFRGAEALDVPPKTAFTLGDRHVTGDVGGRAVRQQKPIGWTEAEKPKKGEEASRRFTKLNIPAARPLRAANAAGATSFHFSHEAISKTRAEKVTARGTKNRKGAAADHTSYIERDGALAKGSQTELDKIQAELIEKAKNDPELARSLSLDLTPSAEASQEPAESLPDNLGAGGQASAYIEREEALAHDPNGSAVLFSNISDDPVERREFWKLVERAESNPSTDKMQIRIAGNEEFWFKVAADEDCPKPVQDAIAAADPNEIVKITTRDNVVVRAVMKRHGWKPRERRPADETDEQKATREEREVAASFGAKFEDGRGGRVQFRIVGELPHEVSHEARVRILKDFTREFEARSLPHIAVMHAPDHTNDDRNWHFHLVYHDRPVRRFTGLAQDHLKPLSPAAGPKTIRQHQIMADAINDPAIQKYVGQWDFTVPWSYRKANRHTMTTTPFAQFKDRDCNKREFVPTLRRNLAYLTNRELEAEGIERRVDPRRYSEMGIHKESDEHLGTQAASLESNGVPTEIGVRNEANQWEFILRKLQAQSETDQARIDQQLKIWRAGLSAVQLSEQDRKDVDRELIRWEQSERVAAEHRAIARQMADNIDRLRSRANKVAEMAKKHLGAIEDGRATKRQKASKPRYQAKLTEAEMHLAGLEIMLGQEISQITTSNEAAMRHTRTAKTAKLVIEGHIELGRQRPRPIEQSVVPRTAKEPQKVAAPTTTTKPEAATPAIGSDTIDSYVNSIVELNRRLVSSPKGIVPRDRVSIDMTFINSPNYAYAQKRLVKIMDHQENAIGNLVAALQRNPGMVQFRQEPTERDYMLTNAERFKIGTPDRALQAAFVNFTEEPEIVAELKKAEVRLLNERAAKSLQALMAKAEDKIVPPSASVEASKSTQAKQPETPTCKPAQDQLRIIETMRAKYLRPKITKTDAGLELTFSKADAALFNLPANLVVGDARSISRIEGIARTHDRAVKRLISYMAKNPSKVKADENGEAHKLADTTPAELVDISNRFSRDPEVVRALQNALAKAHMETSDPRKTLATQVPAKLEPQKGGEGGFGLFKIEDGKIVMPTQDLPEVEIPDWRTYEPSGYDNRAPRKDEDQKPKERERATIKIDPSRAHEFASSNEPAQTRKLQPGIDPMFDRWIKANASGDREERARLSALIRQNEKLREIAQSVEPGYAASFKADWERHDEQLRNKFSPPNLGREV
ncbi:MAG: hypothetical protein CL820_11010 [Croceicoccus sp.]|nr:hypothetical protein [Croceicoccus sp.]|tara:strand:- start:8148 stop:11954 length:3807 start_codon:yes stop_codon:yes gene_type:complete